MRDVSLVSSGPLWNGFCYFFTHGCTHTIPDLTYHGGYDLNTQKNTKDMEGSRDNEICSRYGKCQFGCLELYTAIEHTCYPQKDKVTSRGAAVDWAE